MLKFTVKNERKILKAFLLSKLHQIFCGLLINKENFHQDFYEKEYFNMDSKIMQYLIQNILDTEQYTLEGIAYYTRIPFDVIYDAACGISNHMSITPWARIVALYLKVNPDVSNLLINKLLAINDQSTHGLFLLLLEMGV